MRYWVGRYGMAAFSETVPTSGDASFKDEPPSPISALRSPGNLVGTPVPDDNRHVAAKEIKKVIQLMDNASNMTWHERWRWLHRVKGIVATLRAANDVTSLRPLTAHEQSAADAILSTIESLRPLGDTPPDMTRTWTALKGKMELILGGEAAPWAASMRMRPPHC